MASYILIFLLFLLQFVYFPIGFSHLETPKVYAAEIGIFLLMFLYILKSKKNFQTKGSFILLLSIFAMSLIHLIFFATPTTFFGNDFRLQGVLLLWMLMAFALVSANIPIVKRVHPFFLLGCLAAQFVAAGIIDGNGVERAVGLLGEPNALSAAVLFVWPFLYFSKSSKPARRKILIGIALLLVSLVIFISGSRSGMIAFVVQLIFIGLITHLRISFKWAIVISLVLILATYTLPFVFQSGLYENRSEIWQSAFQAGLQKPILGHGFGNTEYALKEAIVELPNRLKGYYVDSSHNIFLDWWVQGGVVGLGLFLYLLFQTLSSLLKQKNTLAIVVFVGLITALSFNPASIVSLIAFWWLIGQGMKE